MGSRNAFAEAVASEGSLWRLLQVLERPDPGESSGSRAEANATKQRAASWPLLEALASAPLIATELVSTSGWLELLGIAVGYAKFSTSWAARLGACSALSRLLWDPATTAVIGKNGCVCSYAQLLCSCTCLHR